MQRDGKMLLQDAIKRSTACFLIPPSTHVIASPCSPVYALSSKQHTLFIKGECKATFLLCIAQFSSPQEKRKVTWNPTTARKGFHVPPGDQDPSCREAHTRESQSRLFIFQLGECDITKQFIISPPNSELQTETHSGDSLEETCDLYLQKRLHSCLMWIYIYIFRKKSSLKLTDSYCDIHIRMLKWCLVFLMLPWRALSVDERNKAVKESWKRLEESSIMLTKADRQPASKRQQSTV